MTKTALIKQYYDQRAETEWYRLNRYKMEFDMTKKIFQKYLPKSPAKICDIGGGPGRYSFYLSKLNYEITLIDLSDKCIEAAKIRAKKEKINSIKCFAANAMYLNFLPDEFFDVVLLMGPLYHLIKKDEREKVLRESSRILKKNGLIFASFINKYSRIRYIANIEPTLLQKNKKYIDTLITRNITEGPMEYLNNKKSFTTAFYVEPDQINEIMKKYFEKLDLYGLEPIAGRPYDKIVYCNEKVWNDWVNLSFQLGNKKSLLGNSDHYLYIGRKY